MNASRIAICILAIALPSNQTKADAPRDRVVNALLSAHNRERRLKKLGPLTLSSKLCESAQIHARDMADNHFFNHKGSDGSKPFDRIKRVGYVYVRAGENIAMGSETVRSVMYAWMKSPGHRANILSDYTEMGAAWIEDDRGAIYWCVNFGTPKSQRKPGEAGAGTVKRINDEAAAAVIGQINLERETCGKVPFKSESRLGHAAFALSVAMAAKDSLEIDRELFTPIDRKALESWEIRLEVGANMPTPQEAAKKLVGERGEELAAFDEIGVGFALAKSGTPYWCAIFAKRAGGGRLANPR
jgi:uncharacterized protein YkwD